MKIFAIIIINESDIVNSAYELSSFGFFQRSTVKEFIVFLSKEIMKRTSLGQTQTIVDDKFAIHIQLRPNNIGYICICDSEYPQRVAYSILISLDLESILNDIIVKYQDPSTVDKITKINKDLDETITIIQKTITSVLNRGEKIDDLVLKSNDLSAQSKLFYKNTSDLNRCCIIS